MRGFNVARETANRPSQILPGTGRWQRAALTEGSMGL